MKKIESDWCPWCGKQQIYGGIKYKKIKWRNIYYTECCNKATVDDWWFEGELIVVFILCTLIRVFLMPEHGLRMGDTYIIFLPLTLYFFLTKDSRVPKRIIVKAGKRYKAEPELFLGRASVRWYRVKEGGIGFPYLRLINNMIFPVCFVNTEGTPVSQTVCVRLQKRFLYFWRNAGVRLITEDLWKADADGKVPWEKAEKFLIFNCGEVIGEGRIK